jgi:hypothetical protein
VEVLQLASQHQGDQAIDSLAGLASNPDSGATGHSTPPRPHKSSPDTSSQVCRQASCEAQANNAYPSASIKAATAPGVVSTHPIMLCCQGQ